MSCDAWRERIVGFLDGELEPEERARLEEHLGGCPHCRGELAELEATSAVMRRWEPADPPAGLVFVPRRRRRPRLAALVEGSRLPVLLPAGLGGALAAVIVMAALGHRRPDPAVNALEAELDSLRDRVAAAEAAAEVAARTAAARTAAARTAAARTAAMPGAPGLAPSPGAAADLAPGTRAWLRQAVDSLVRESESRQDMKLLLTADQLARSIALQRREDLSAIDRRLRDVQAETFEALVSTHERLDRIATPAGAPAGGGRLEPR